MKIIIWLMNSVLTIIETLLGVRFLFRLLAANLSAPIVRWIFHITDIFVYPFREIFPSYDLGASHVIDFGILFAILGFALIAYFIMLILNQLDRAIDRASHPPGEQPPYTKK